MRQSQHQEMACAWPLLGFQSLLFNGDQCQWKWPRKLSGVADKLCILWITYVGQYRSCWLWVLSPDWGRPSCSVLITTKLSHTSVSQLQAVWASSQTEVKDVRVWGCGSIAGHLCIMHEALGEIFSAQRCTHRDKETHTSPQRMLLTLYPWSQRIHGRESDPTSCLWPPHVYHGMYNHKISKCKSFNF